MPTSDAIAPVHLRPATAADCAFLAQVCRAVAPRYEALIPGAFERQAKRYETEGLPAQYQIEIIEEKGVPAGFLGTAGLTPRILYLAALYFLPDRQRQGLGSAVMRMLIVRGYRSDTRKIALLTHPGADWALRFYEKHGFTRVAVNRAGLAAYAGGALQPFLVPDAILLQAEL